ncbi:glycosyltransferase [Roseococcus sp. DSY-14]|uniref:glycosyltransferase n=1 Tax=Roseococcus sp. DSY-14 TaxID=3369650 RepID=UPI00387ABCC3
MSAPAGPVAVLSHTHPSVSKGGAEIAAHTLFQGLRRLGVPAIFVAAVPRRLAAEVVPGGPDEHVLLHDEERYDHFFNLGDPALAAELAALLRARGVALACFHHFLNFGAGALRAVRQGLGIPTFLVLHEFLAMCAHHGQMVTRPARLLCPAATPLRCLRCFPEGGIDQVAARHDLMREALGLMDGLVAPSAFLAGRFAGWGLPPGRIAVIENGLAGFDGLVPPPRPADGKAVIGVFGQLTPFKGLNTVLDAADLLAAEPELAARLEIRLHGLLVGQEPAFAARFEEALRRHPFLRFAGPYENEGVRRLMAATDAVLVPSTWWENSPLVIQEAYAAGRPVICSGIGGMAEKVPEGVAGLHFEPGSAAGLLGALRDFAARPAGGWALPAPLDEREMAARYLRAFGMGAARPRD